MAEDRTNGQADDEIVLDWGDSRLPRNTETTDGGTNDQPGDNNALPANLQKILDEERKKVEQQIADALASGDQNNGIYKGLQKHLNARNNELAELKRELAARDARLAELSAGLGVNQDQTQFVMETLLSALDDKTRDEVKAALEQRKGANEIATMKRELEALKNPPKQSAQEQVAEQVSQFPGQEEFLKQVQERRTKFIDSRKAMAEKMGVKPDHPALDYGTDDDGVMEISEKFEASLFKILESKDEEELESVRPRFSPPATRTGGGGTPGSVVVDPFDFQTLLNRGAESRLKKLGLR